jgi:hypothetical protein
LKGVIRRPGVQKVLARVLSAYIRLMLHTVRWRHENLECLHPAWDGPGGAIGFLWHGRIPICLSVAPQWWTKRTKVLVSPSVDGEFIAQALARSNLPAIRASSAKQGDTAKARAVVGAVHHTPRRQQPESTLFALLTRHAGENARKCHIFQRRLRRNKVKRLEDKPHRFAAEFCQSFPAEGV